MSDTSTGSGKVVVNRSMSLDGSGQQHAGGRRHHPSVPRPEVAPVDSGYDGFRIVERAEGTIDGLLPLGG